MDVEKQLAENLAREQRHIAREQLRHQKEAEHRAEIRSGFLRQRRNLSVVSLVLLFSQVVGLKFEQVNVFGNTAIISDPVGVYMFLWIFWGYWILRYGQYLHDLGSLGILNEALEYLHRRLAPYVEKTLPISPPLASEIVSVKNLKDALETTEAGRLFSDGDSGISWHQGMTGRDWLGRILVKFSQRGVTVALDHADPDRWYVTLEPMRIGWWRSLWFTIHT